MTPAAMSAPPVVELDQVIWVTYDCAHLVNSSHKADVPRLERTTWPVKVIQFVRASSTGER